MKHSVLILPILLLYGVDASIVIPAAKPVSSNYIQASSQLLMDTPLGSDTTLGLAEATKKMMESGSAIGSSEGLGEKRVQEIRDEVPKAELNTATQSILLADRVDTSTSKSIIDTSSTTSSSGTSSASSANGTTSTKSNSTTSPSNGTTLTVASKPNPSKRGGGLLNGLGKFAGSVLTEVAPDLSYAIRSEILGNPYAQPPHQMTHPYAQTPHQMTHPYAQPPHQMTHPYAMQPVIHQPYQPPTQQSYQPAMHQPYQAQQVIQQQYQPQPNQVQPPGLNQQLQQPPYQQPSLNPQALQQSPTHISAGHLPHYPPSRQPQMMPAHYFSEDALYDDMPRPPLPPPPMPAQFYPIMKPNHLRRKFKKRRKHCFCENTEEALETRLQKMGLSSHATSSNGNDSPIMDGETSDSMSSMTKQGKAHMPRTVYGEAISDGQMPSMDDNYSPANPYASQPYYKPLQPQRRPSRIGKSIFKTLGKVKMWLADERHPAFAYPRLSLSDNPPPPPAGIRGRVDDYGYTL